jgi:hypothetical protein
MMSSIEDIMQLNASEAIKKGRAILAKMLEDCSDVATEAVQQQLLQPCPVLSPLSMLRALHWTEEVLLLDSNEIIKKHLGPSGDLRGRELSKAASRV